MFLFSRNRISLIKTTRCYLQYPGIGRKQETPIANKLQQNQEEGSMMKRLSIFLFLFCCSKLSNVVLFLCILNTDQSTSEKTSAYVEPILVTQPKQEVVEPGGELRLPCFLETMFDYILIWKFSRSGQTDTILSIDEKMINGGEGGRVSVEREGEGNWLVVSQVEEGDSGTYTCIVSGFQPKSVEHQVIVHSRPEVDAEQDVFEGNQGVGRIPHVSTEHSDLDEPTLFGDYEASTKISGGGLHFEANHGILSSFCALLVVVIVGALC